MPRGDAAELVVVTELRYSLTGCARVGDVVWRKVQIASGAFVSTKLTPVTEVAKARISRAAARWTLLNAAVPVQSTPRKVAVSRLALNVYWTVFRAGR